MFVNLALRPCRPHLRLLQRQCGVKAALRTWMLPMRSRIACFYCSRCALRRE